MNRPFDLTVITFNISADFLAPKNVPVWAERKDLCLQTLRQAQPSLIALQEVMPGQFDFLQSHLSEFSPITVAQTTADETILQPIRQHYGLQTLPSPNEVVLFFQTKMFDKIAQGHWWLSPTPDRISVGFGNIAPRLVLWARLRHKALAQEIIALSTHLDNRALRPMAQMCRAKVAPLSQAGLPLIFMGDFNIDPARDEYKLLTGDGWRDAYEVALAANPDRGDISTFSDGRRIDHVLYHGDALKPWQWLRLTSPDPERRLSDHDPVLVRFWLNPSES